MVEPFYNKYIHVMPVYPTQDLQALTGEDL